MSMINELFEQGFDLYKFLTEKAKTRNATKKLLIREIRDNLKLLEHRNKQGVDTEALISKLSNTVFLKAISENYNFKSFVKKGRITAAIYSKIPRAKKYENWDADKLIGSIDEKIASIKIIREIYPNLKTAPVNLTYRFDNLYLQLVLLSYLIKMSEK